MDSVRSSFCSPSLLPPPLTPSQIRSDVFLSFRGEDTRDNFTSHLHKALVDKQVVTFIDNKLNRGDEISPSLLKAIEGSQIAIIIFSQDYASSRWCLEELVKILECRENHGQIVIPIFYKIDPFVVRKQTGSFEVAFAKHQSLKENSRQVTKWKDALNLAGNISGFDSHVVKSESVLIEEIVQKVLEDLKKQNNVSTSVNKKLVGIESRIKDIELRLDDVRSVGIWGIGGIGKTTLAKAVYEKISCQFEGFHFVESVREALERKEPKCLRQELYLAVLGDKNLYNHQVIKIRFSRMKLLIILDDVTSIKQVDDLIGDLDYFGLGSRIIIISRDQQVLKNYGVDYIYEVKELSFDNALMLFCQHAFKQNCPRVGYMKLSKGVVRKVGGVPLALKVFGSFLLDKIKEVWESSMKKLENSLDNNIYEVLKISYDELDPDQQNAFLDIAYFYEGWDINLVIAIMDASGFCIANELSALMDKSLIIISFNKIMMHDLLQAMGKRIVRQESIDPGERTRLCNHNDIYDVLTEATGTKKIEGISLDMSNTRDIHLHPDAFVNMRNLRFLQFYISNYWSDNNNKVHVLQDHKFFWTKLRYFEWERCPLKSLQSNSHLENLVIFKLRYSNVEQLWSGVQQFDHLKEIDLCCSEKLIRLPNLKAPKLERLDLEACASLIEIPQLPKSLKFVSLIGCSKLQRLPELPNNLVELHLRGCSSLIEIPSSIQHLTRLDRLVLSGCKNFTSIPDCTGLISLRYLHLFICSKLERLANVPNNLVELDLKGCSKLQRLPELPNNLESLDLKGCSSLIEIPSSIQHLTRLDWLVLSGCKSLTSIPDCTGLISLQYLYLSHCSKLERLPGIPDCLKELDLQDCSKLQRLPELPNNLQQLILGGCSSLIEIPSSIQHLTRLDWLALSGCKSLTSIPDFTGLISLRYLHLSHCSKLERLSNIPNNLVELDLKGCSKLQRLPELPNNLESLDLGGCSSLIEIPSSIQHPTRPSYLNFSGCKSLTSIPDCTGLISLEHPYLHSCSKRERLPVIPNNFEELDLEGCTSFFEIPSSFTRLNELNSLILRDCERLKVLPKLAWVDMDASNCTSLQELSCPSSLNDFFVLDSSQFMRAKFIDCFKSDQNSLDNFMKDTQREIQPQSPSYLQVYEGKGPPFNLCFQSCEIPKWFDFQSTGSFIDVKLPLDWIDYNFICCSLCAIMSFPDQFELPNNLPALTFTEVTYKCYVKSKEGGHNSKRMCGVWFRRNNYANYHRRSSHMIIGSGFHFFRELHDTEFTFQFDGSKDSQYRENCKVEKCGVRLTFGKHIEKLIKMRRLMNCTVKNPRRMMNNILKNSIEEDEPNPKMLKHI